MCTRSILKYCSLEVAQYSLCHVAIYKLVCIERLRLRHNCDVKQLPYAKMYTLCNGMSSTFCCSSAVLLFRHEFHTGDSKVVRKDYSGK